MRPPRVRPADDEDDDGIRAPRSFRRTVSTVISSGSPWYPVAAAVLLSAVLHLLWLVLIASGGGDLAAQDAWAEFVGQHPDSAYNLAWYGGMHPVSYSVISPYLMAVFGVRPMLILSGVLSAGVLALILARSRAVPRPMPPALCGAVAFACNAASGRVTFAMGTFFALAAVAIVWACPGRWRHMRKTRGALVVLMSVLATAGSPVSGLFLMVVGAALVLSKRRAAAAAIGLPPPLVVGVSALLFPFTGEMPMPWWSAVFPLVSSVSVRLLAPPGWRVVRRGAEVYTLGILVTWAVPSQVGANVERLGLMFGVVALVALLPLMTRRSRRWMALVTALIVVGGWQLVKPTWDVVNTTPAASWAHDLAPLVHQLKEVDADRGRVEVVPVQSHREASAFAPYVNLARGWNRQADTERNPLFYEGGGRLTEERYHEWLRRWAVRYVVLSSDKPDVAARGEARLVRSEPDYLSKVWSDENWELYRVTDPVPLAAPPAHDSRSEAGGVTVEVRAPGEVLVRVPWSPWLGLVTEDGEPVDPPDRVTANRNGCLRPAEPMASESSPETPEPAKGEGEEGDDEPPKDEWTVLDAPRAGTYRLAAPYRFPRGTPCPDGQSG